MSEAIKSSIILAMADSLDTNELGSAIRILARLIEKNSHIPLRNLHIIAGVTKDEWIKISPNILPYFSINETHIALLDTFLDIPQVASNARQPRKGITPPLFPETKGHYRPESLPSYLASRPKEITLRKAIYDTGIRLLMKNGLSEKVSRGILSNFIKTYDIGDIASVLEDAKKQIDIIDTHSWIVAGLKKRSQQKTRDEITSRENNKTKKQQMSEKTKRDIIQRNRTLDKLRFGKKQKIPAPSLK